MPDDPNDKLDLCVQIYFVLPEPAPFIAQPEPIGVRVINYSGNKFKLNMLTRKRKQTHHMIEYIACGVPGEHSLICPSSATATPPSSKPLH